MKTILTHGKMNYERTNNKKNYEIGPYIRRTKLFDDFYGIDKDDGNKVVIRIFPFPYNLSNEAINRIKNIHNKLGKSIYAQELLECPQDQGTGITSLIFKYYPKIPLETLRESGELFYTKFIPSFIYKGILCLQELRNLKICHHDICLENVYFAMENEASNNNEKNVNQNPLKFTFKLLNWTFATVAHGNSQSNNMNQNKSLFNTNNTGKNPNGSMVDERKDHKVAITPRYQYNCNLEDTLTKDPYKRDLWDFAITVLSLFNEEDIPELLSQIDNKSKINWIPFLKNYHQYKEHCQKVKFFFEKVFDLKCSSEKILIDLIFNDFFTLDFL